MTIAIIFLFLAYSAFREWLFNARIKDLELKLLAKTPQEYAQYKMADTPATASEGEPETDDLIDVFDASPEDFLKGQTKP